MLQLHSPASTRQVTPLVHLLKSKVLTHPFSWHWPILLWNTVIYQSVTSELCSRCQQSTKDMALDKAHKEAFSPATRTPWAPSPIHCKPGTLFLGTQVNTAFGRREKDRRIDLIPLIPVLASIISQQGRGSSFTAQWRLSGLYGLKNSTLWEEMYFLSQVLKWLLLKIIFFLHEMTPSGVHYIKTELEPSERLCSWWQQIPI